MLHIITGQTATGKTKRAIELAAQEDGEIINADARQIYKRLDIITGKDLDLTTGTFHEFKKFNQLDIGYYELKTSQDSSNIQLQTTNYQLPTIPSRIWLYDVVDPERSFSAVEYADIARVVIKDILSRGKTPIIVGGTYFYLKQLLYSATENRIPPDEALRNSLAQKSVVELQQILSDKNLILFRSLNNSERHNPQRLIRRIEIESSQKSTNVENSPFEYEYDFEGYYYESRAFLHENIEKRVQSRLDAGAVQEVESLLAAGYSSESPGLLTIGYRQIIAFLEGKIDSTALKSEWISKEVQYAKRQRTFMKKDAHIKWHAVDKE